jgi:ABC-type transport system substrate-binding protein
MSKKILVLISLITIFSLFLSACGGATPAPATNAPAATNPPAPTVVSRATAPSQATALPTVVTSAPTATAVTVAPSGGVLTIGMGSEPETLDPGDAVYVQEQFILISLFDSLLSMAPDATLHPGLALTWTPNDAYTEFTFTLRQDVTFHDGTPFKADAVTPCSNRVARLCCKIINT